MALEVNSRVEEYFGVLELAGTLTIGPWLKSLRETAQELLGTKKLNGVILRVGGVTMTDSSGLGELTVVYTLAKKKGCPVRLVEVSSSLQKMLEMTRLDGLLPSAMDVSAAMADMKKSN